MAVAALIVAIVAALAALGSFWYAKQLDEKAKRAVAASERSAAAAEDSARSAERSAAAGERSAIAGEDRAAQESSRRHDELTPQFRVVVTRREPTGPFATLSVVLLGPLGLGRLDRLTVTIKDNPRLPPQVGGKATPEQIAEMVWGPYRFISGTDDVRHVASDEGMQVGEELSFTLYRTSPPSWSLLESQPGAWQLLAGTLLRLRLEAHREGWEPWTLDREVNSEGEQVTIEVPGDSANG
jgi:hypothetical protein